MIENDPKGLFLFKMRDRERSEMLGKAYGRGRVGTRFSRMDRIEMGEEE